MKINHKYTTIILSVLIITLMSVVAVLAGNTDSPGGPGESGSQMYTLEQIYNRLTTGATTAKMTTFTEPSSGPGSTMHTLDDIMAAAPTLDNSNGATTSNVLAGQTFWGLTAGQWATQTGTMPDNGAGSTIVPTTSNQNIAAGYWSSANTVLGDSDLVASNIVSGTNIFGVDGSAETASGNATPEQVLNGITFSNSSGASVGTMPNNGVGSTIVPTTSNQSVAAGYWSSANTVLGDSDLVASNIVSGTNIFGVDGSGILASGNATSGQVLNGVAFCNASGAATGTMPNNGAGSTLVPTTTNQSVAAGYWSSANTVLGDSDLVAGNIKNGVTIFGVTGTFGTCGNGVIDAGEVCDFGALGGETCTSQLAVEAVGTLGCAPGCAGFDTSTCQARYEPQNVGGDQSVVDHLTGLEWVVTHNADATQNLSDPADADNIYSWSLNDGNFEANGTVFTGYIDLLNTGAYGGHTDWRLPTSYGTMLDDLGNPAPAFGPGELDSIKDCSLTHCIDETLFGPYPLLPVDSHAKQFPGFYWTSISYGPNFVQTVQFIDAQPEQPYPKISQLSARAVRGGP